VSNVITGPNQDIRATQTIYDQFGRDVSNRVQVLREDKLTQVVVNSEIRNDVNPTAIADPDNFIHLGGMCLSLDGFEHALMFNNFTLDGNLLFDPFIGLNVIRFRVQFDRHPEPSRRPNMGGYFFSPSEETNVERNTQVRNIEGQMEDISLYYDTFKVAETSDVIPFSRALLGYDVSQTEFLEHVDADPKAQFIFWRGLIQAKGSRNMVNAFINSRRFIDARVDEYFAYELAEFGDIKDREFPEIKLFASDVDQNTLRLHFTTPSGNDNELEAGFEEIVLTDDTRWFDRPDQVAIIPEITPPSAQNLFFDAEVTSILEDPCPEAIYKIVDVTVSYTGNDIFSIDGNHTSVFTPGFVFKVIGSTGNDDTYTVDFTSFNGISNETEITPEQAIVDITSDGKITGTFFLLDVRADGVFVTFDKFGTDFLAVPPVGEAIRRHVLPGTGPFTTITLPFEYIVGADNLNVFVNGTPTTAFTETSNTVITFDNPTTGVVIVSIKTGKLVEDTHFTRINAEVISIPEWFELGNFKIHTLTSAKTKLNPSKVIDFQSDTTVSEIPIFDPARGHYYHQAIHVVDLQRDTDPAKYSTSFDNNIDLDNQWNAEEVGTVWFNTEKVGFIPYYDPLVFPDTEERIFLWSSLAEWADNEGWEWTESTVTPSEWDALALTQQSDSSIDPNIRASGTARQILFSRTRENETFTIAAANPASHTVNLDSTLFSILKANDPTELGFGLFRAQATVTDKAGTPTVVDIIVNGTNAQTFGELLVEINNDLKGIATASLGDTTILFEADDNDATRRITISDGPGTALFDSLESNSLPLFVDFGTEVDAADSRLFGISAAFQVDGLEVFLQTDDTLPSPLAPQTKFFLVEDSFTFPSVLTQYLLATTSGGTPIEVDSGGIGTHTILKADFPATFDREVDDRRRFYVALTPDSPVFCGVPGDAGDTVEVYKNGRFLEDATVSTVIIGADTFNIITVAGTLSIEDFLDVIKQAREPTEAQLAFDPDVSDDGTFLTQFKEDFDFTEVTIDDVTRFYFWVQDKTVRPTNRLLSLQEVETQLSTPPTPFIFFQKLLPLETGVDTNNQTAVLPNRFTQAIIRGLVAIVTEDERFKLRFTRDFALRTDINDFPLNPSSDLNLKNKHVEWKLFRQEQPFNIDRVLWDKLTEAVVGFNLDDIATGSTTPTPVPSLDRVLYDNLLGTATRFGLRFAGQAFTDKTISLDTIQTLITTPSFDISPINKEVFLAANSFDTPQNIKTSMEVIFNNFPQDAVNTIFFATLLDALSLRNDYPGILKTSMVSLHGIKLLETVDIVNDF